ncbi:glycosyltransferase family 2 protein [Desmonostoc muscorum LEGE 12446]|uniref:Glycosyltransferase family 2 protein n=1 Tax=Desmonostoc muscorum LEGE 12446 TaxID=1828758 RepID=A0A8J7CWL5_DESMC|nr:glycosyltransferase family 2 protein [Desmonostoc muscorum]MCF2146318.1 glycosyltransferase family 2 protein [Desmonostoc muscorum LEGE 12446]
MQLTTIAVLLTCYNRREKTLQCLQALSQQSLTTEIQLKTYLVDDGSTDGTTEAIQQKYPNVHLIRGTGSLFWNGGMRSAFAAAQLEDPDYYLWLNDDTVLYPHALKTLLGVWTQLASQGQEEAIVVGSTLDPETGIPSYGGLMQTYWWHPLKFHHVHPDPDQPRHCDTLHGNCVLVPRAVAALVGNLNPKYTHDLGDYDYGLKARRQGCSVYMTPGYLGTCSANPPSSRMANTELAQANWNQVDRPKGLPLNDVTLHSFHEWKVFCRENGGIFWFFYWLLPYRRLLWLMLSKRLSYGIPLRS